MARTAPYDVWAHTLSGSIVIGSNTKHVPSLPHWDPLLDTRPIPRIDGHWGLLEYSVVPQLHKPKFPYLAWMPTGSLDRLNLNVYINKFRLQDNPAAFVRHPSWPQRGYLETTIREKLQADVVVYICQVETLIASQESSRLSESVGVTPPVIAMVRAHNASFCMRSPHLTYRDLLEYIAGLQQSVAELQAYILWCDQMLYAELPTTVRNSETGLRGSIAVSEADYLVLRNLGVPVWLELGSENLLRVEGSKQVLLQRVSVETGLWQDAGVARSLQNIRGGALVHNKPLEYYPPPAAASTNFEDVARGYAARTDKYNEDRYSRADVSRMLQGSDLSRKNHNISPRLAAEVRRAGDLAGDLMEKYAAERAMIPQPEPPALVTPKGPAPSSKWYRQHLAVIESFATSQWAPKFIESWEMGLHNTSGYPLVHDIQLFPRSCELLLFVAPPPHLFLNKPREKTAVMLFIWVYIRRAWMARIDRDLDCNESVCHGLTTGQWREVLGGTYWKMQHPRAFGGISSFNARFFWKYGGPLIFGSDTADDFLSMDLSPIISQSTTGRLELSSMDDDSVKQLILWDLTLCHAQIQLDRTDEILFAHKLRNIPVALDVRRTRRSGLFHESTWNIPAKIPPWERGESEPQRQHWLARLVEKVKEWPCASQVEWFLARENFSAGGGERPLMAFCNGLTEGKLCLLEMTVVACYYQGVFNALGILAVGVVKRPKATSAIVTDLYSI
ncbi:hypothetical protein R3P38DRAFT_3313818 [Favolaschia claudopus]|uniref:Uncharacterized protein n=1 Tax=Favolaschia claudopus TaxID=2862362 RepID=A0AAW0BYL2_9AGAR